MKTRLDNNLRAVEGNGDVEIRIEDVNISGDAAFVTICAFDTVVIFDIGDPTNSADDIIYNDAKESYRVRWELRQLDDRWLLFDNVGLEDLKDGDLCGF